MSNVGTQAAGRRKPVVRYPARLATNVRRLDFKLQLHIPKKQISKIPKKHMSKRDMPKERAVDKAVDDLLRDDDAQTEQMNDVADPVPPLRWEARRPSRRAKIGAGAHPIAVLETKKMADDTKMKSKVRSVSDPIHASKTVELDFTSLLMLTNLAITHKDLKPYDI